MTDQLDTAKMRAWVRERYKASAGTHYDGCEYDHEACAILKLCDEVDRLNAMLDELYNQGDPPMDVADLIDGEKTVTDWS